MPEINDLPYDTILDFAVFHGIGEVPRAVFDLCPLKLSSPKYIRTAEAMTKCSAARSVHRPHVCELVGGCFSMPSLMACRQGLGWEVMKGVRAARFTWQEMRAVVGRAHAVRQKSIYEGSLRILVGSSGPSSHGPTRNRAGKDFELTCAELLFCGRPS